MSGRSESVQKDPIKSSTFSKFFIVKALISPALAQFMQIRTGANTFYPFVCMPDGVRLARNLARSLRFCRFKIRIVVFRYLSTSE